MHLFFKLIFIVVLLLQLTLYGCGSSSSTSVVTIQKIDDLYYRTDIDMLATSHTEIGQLYATEIKNRVSDFEAQADAGLKATVEMMQKYDSTITFQTLIDRANIIFSNVPADYQDEIRGMQSVFSSNDDTLGNGQLSRNKILVYELAPDVARIVSCSASAAFGNATPGGKTIIGRNLEWHDEVLPYMASQHNITVLHNGSKSIVYFGFMGQLYPISGFNSAPVFVAVLDSDVGIPYYLEGSERSYMFELRYALENQTTIQGIADSFEDHDYAYDFNVFLADKTTSDVLEVDVNTPFSGLRTSMSALKTDTEVPILPWNLSDAIASVNWFSLPGTLDNTAFYSGNAPRWSSFINLYEQRIGRIKITTDIMKQIMGYVGANNNGKAESGAIWRYDDGESEVQSIIMDMGTFKTWVSFQPAGQSFLHAPNYIQVFSDSPF